MRDCLLVLFFGLFMALQTGIGETREAGKVSERPDGPKELKERMRTALLTPGRMKQVEISAYRPVLSDLKRVVRGEATEDDISKIVSHGERLLTQKGQKDSACAIGFLLYLYEGDLRLFRSYTQKTTNIPFQIEYCFFREDGSIRENFVKETDAEKLSDYIADAIVLRLSHSSRGFYEEGTRRFWIGNMSEARLLARLPRSLKRDRVLVNYPFELSGPIWQIYAHPDILRQKMKMWPESARHVPENIFKHYYCEVIQEAGLEQEFITQLKLRNMAEVIPEGLKRKRNQKENKRNGCADCP
jgi:hypothetical protein